VTNPNLGVLVPMGGLDELRNYHRALAADELATNHLAGADPAFLEQRQIRFGQLK
jgi:hypothetical protein